MRKSPGKLNEIKSLGGHKWGGKIFLLECLQNGPLMNILKVHSDPPPGTSPRGSKCPKNQFFANISENMQF